MRRNLFAPLVLSLLFLVNSYGQERGQPPPDASRSHRDSGVCGDGPGQALANQTVTHRFRYVGETLEISLRGGSLPASVADCEPVAMDLHWANGRNNGSNFNVTFLDSNKRPIYARQFPGFLSGVLQFSLTSFDAQRGSGLSLISVPTSVTIQAVRPFAAPANLSYTITRVARAAGAGGRSSRQEQSEETSGGRRGESGGLESSGMAQENDRRRGNEIVSIHSSMRLIGASRLPVVQIELKTSRPFPVRDVPLQLQIGKKVFVDELSGDYTGRKLTLSLTPEMFAELKDGDEVLAFFGTRATEGDVWYFGKLIKSRVQEQ